MGDVARDSKQKVVRLEPLEPRQLLSFSISGRVFEDLNQNGKHQSKEPFLPNVQVFLDQNGNGRLDAGEPSATTDKHGNFRFKRLPRGSYDLRVIAPIGLAAELPATADYVFTNLRHGASRVFALKVAPPSVQREPSDTTPPLVQFNATDLTSASAAAYQFTVTYTDSSGVDVSSLGNGNIAISLPGNVTQLATLQSTAMGGNGSTITATYELASPTGDWTADDNGVYTLSLVGDQVRDGVGNADPAQTLGSFNVAIGIPTLTVPVLARSSDTGASSTDHLTRLNNAGAGNALSFQVGGAIAGSIITLFADGNGIGSTTAIGSSVTISTDGQTVLSPGVHTFTARQTLSNGLNSGLSDGVGLTIDDTPPAAQLLASDINTSGGILYSFTVTYSDGSAVDATTLGDGNVSVIGPNGFSTSARLLAVDRSGNEPTVIATYSITPPGGSWDANANGTYTVNLQPGQVQDIAGNVMSADALGTFDVNAVTPGSDQPGPPRLTVASDTGAFSNDGVTRLNNSINAPLQFTVPGTVGGATITLFADGTAVGSAIASGNVTALTTNGAITLGDGVHQFTARQTEPGLPQSTDSTADAILIDTAPPSASANPAGVANSGSSVYSFAVIYQDNFGINVSSIDSDDIAVTGPAGFLEAAQFMSVDNPTDGMPRIATYRITPPDGAWTSSDNGIYSIVLHQNQVFDVAGNAASGGTIATFAVSVTLSASPTPSTPQLAPASDTGLLSNDNVTKLNNASTSSTLHFVVGNTVTGAAVTLLADGVQIGSSVATGTRTTIVTDGSMRLSDGPHVFTAHQIVPGALLSADSAGVSVLVDSTLPTASAAFAPVSIGGSAEYDFSVVFSDNVAIDASTLDGNDLVVTGPNGFAAKASLVSVDSRSGSTPRSGSYRFVPPGGIWDAADNGAYTVTLQGAQVFDTAGNAAGQAVLGAFVVNIAAQVSAAPGAPALFSTTDSGTSNNDGITNFNNDGRPAALIFSVPGATTGAVVSIYADGEFLGSAIASGAATIVTTRGDLPLSNGRHQITARQQISGAQQSLDSPASTVTVDTTPPTAAVQAANIAAAGNTDYFFNVTYTDATGIDASTLHDSNILVTGPNGYAQAATFVTSSDPSSGSPRTATYQIRPPNDEWTAADNGVYTLALQGGQVSDIAGNVAINATLGVFSIAVPTPAPVAVFLTTAGAALDVNTPLNNSSQQSRLQFTVTGTMVGATVGIYADGRLIGSCISNGVSTTFYSDGVTNLAAGVHQISARQTLTAAPQSADSSSLALTVE